MNKINLLLIEANDFYKKVIKEVVESNFSEVVFSGVANNAESAITLLEKNSPRILILDLDTADKHIPKLLSVSKEKNIRIVFISSLSEHVIESLKFSFVDFVFKPFDVIDLIVALDDVIAELEDKFYAVKIGTLLENISTDREIERLIVKGMIDTRDVSIHDIIEARSVEKGTFFTFSDGSELFSPIPLRRFELILRSHGFVRCNSKTLVNISKIEFLDEEKDILYLDKGLLEAIEHRKVVMLKQLIRDNSVSNVSRLHA